MSGITLDERKAISKWALVSESRPRLEAMLSLAASEPGIPVTPDDLDANPWLFNCMNGTIDLQTGELREHRREDMITQLCPVDYNPDATAPLWESTLRLFLPDPDLRDYWQRLVGYAMTGVVRDHVLVIAYGTGGNGKSTILNTLLSVFGRDFAMKCLPEMLMARHNEAHPTERADLFRKRLVVAIETESGRRLNESLVKELTGGDPIRTRRLYENAWEFNPTHKLFLATNHKPTIRGADEGIWRRLKLVPFDVRVEESAADKTMSEKLAAEYEGILNWCVQGCLAWQARGLFPPRCVINATRDYRAEQDIVGAFISECVLADPSVRVKASDLYAAYATWATANHEHLATQTQFGRDVVARGFEKTKSSGNWYLGIALRQQT